MFTRMHEYPVSLFTIVFVFTYVLIVLPSSINACPWQASDPLSPFPFLHLQTKTNLEGVEGESNNDNKISFKPVLEQRHWSSHKALLWQ